MEVKGRTTGRAENVLELAAECSCDVAFGHGRADGLYAYKQNLPPPAASRLSSDRVIWMPLATSSLALLHWWRKGACIARHLCRALQNLPGRAKTGTAAVDSLGAGAHLSSVGQTESAFVAYRQFSTLDSNVGTELPKRSRIGDPPTDRTACLGPFLFLS